MAQPADQMHATRANTRGASTAALICPARLHHVAMGSPDPQTLARFYADDLDFSATRNEDTFILHGTDRRLVIAPGNARQLLHAGFDLTNQARVASYRAALHRDNVATEDFASPFFAPGAFAISDPDGNAMEFSAEITLHPVPMPPGDWPHEPKTLNLWGAAIMRS